MKKIIPLAIASLLWACNDVKKQETQEQYAPFDHMLGSWTCKVFEDSLTEVWNKTNDSLYTGYSLGISPKGDTSHFETFEVSKKSGVWTYSPKVQGQNNNQSVHFPLTDTSKGVYTFLNAAHDFPSIIKYNLNHKDSVFAFVSGVLNGKETSMDFPMRRIK